MSRIEKALEEAVRMRTDRQYAGSQTADVPLGSETSSPSEAFSESEQDSQESVETVKPLRISNPMLVSSMTDVTIIEEYRKLKSIILQLSDYGRLWNSLVVSSSLPDEGKSITAINLAIVMAQEYDQSVLLVDCDLRKPAISKYLGIEGKPGIIQCLKGETSLDSVLVETGIGRLTVLPAGGVVKNPFEVLSSKVARKFFDRLCNKHGNRYVIIDSPPTLPFADSQVLGSYFDRVLFVVRELRAEPSQIKQALDALKSANVLGVVYNDKTDIARSTYQYY